MHDYVNEVIRCNEPLVSWQMEQPILFFTSYVNVTDVISLGQMLLALEANMFLTLLALRANNIWPSDKKNQSH